jgi:hypothetical protein
VLRYGAVSKRVSPRQPRDRRRLHQFSSVGMRLNVRSCGIIGIRIIPLKPYCTMGGGGPRTVQFWRGNYFPPLLFTYVESVMPFFAVIFESLIRQPPRSMQHYKRRKDNTVSGR